MGFYWVIDLILMGRRERCVLIGNGERRGFFLNGCDIQRRSWWGCVWRHSDHKSVTNSHKIIRGSLLYSCWCGAVEKNDT